MYVDTTGEVNTSAVLMCSSASVHGRLNCCYSLVNVTAVQRFLKLSCTKKGYCGDAHLFHIAQCNEQLAAVCNT
jgi:hypothetical protein